jgi:WD40 repeat protein
VQTLKGFEGSIHALAFSPDGKTLAISDDSFRIQMIDVTRGTPPSRLEGHSDAVEALAFDRDGKLLASAGREKTVRIWDAATLKPLTQFTAPRCCSLAFSPDAKVLAAGCYDTSESAFFMGLQLWTVNGRLLRQVEIKDTPIDALRYSPGGEILAIASRHMYVFYNSTYILIRIHGRHDKSATSVEIINNPDSVISAGLDHCIRVWDLATGGRNGFVLHEQTGAGCFDRILAMFYRRDKGLVETISTDDTIRVWDIRKRVLIQKIALDCANSSNVRFSLFKATFSADGSQLCVVTSDNAILLFRR